MKVSEICTKTKLLAHQEEAVAKLMSSRVGALFMEDGTGRTRTAIELVKLRSSRISNVVWFCPFSIKQTVCNEILKHCGNISDIWNIIGIESMSTSMKSISQALGLINSDSFVIVDESHYIKGNRAKRSGRIIRCSAKARFRLIMSGTPVTQGIQDLFNQIYFLSEDILGYKSFYAFAANHLEFSQGYPQRVIRAHNTEYLAAKMSPYVYQINKNECVELPERIHSTRYFQMSRRQRSYYQLFKQYILTTEEFSAHSLFLLFIRLQQILSGFFIDASGKCVQLPNPRLELLDNIVFSLDPGAKVVIWAKFNYDLETIQKTLPPDETTVLYGNMSADERGKQLAQYNLDKRFLLLNGRIGKYQLKLDQVDVVIFYNNTFSYSDRIRAEECCLSPGSGRRVVFLDLLCLNSIDERINQNLLKKRHLAQEFNEQIEQVKELDQRQKWVRGL